MNYTNAFSGSEISHESRARTGVSNFLGMQNRTGHFSSPCGVSSSESRTISSATRLIAQVDTLAGLSTSSQTGTACPEIGDPVRLFSYKRWVILFPYESHGVDVLRFADGSQDYLSWKI
jgi:plasmid stabilization system protein ParE